MCLSCVRRQTCIKNYFLRTHHVLSQATSWVLSNTMANPSGNSFGQILSLLPVLIHPTGLCPRTVSPVPADEKEERPVLQCTLVVLVRAPAEFPHWFFSLSINFESSRIISISPSFFLSKVFWIYKLCQSNIGWQNSSNNSHALYLGIVNILPYFISLCMLQTYYIRGMCI